MTIGLIILVGIVLFLLILRRPYFGIVFTAASLPIAGVLPNVPFATSVVTIIGGITIPAFLLQRKNKKIKSNTSKLISLSRLHLFGLLFIGWIFITNPQAAIMGRDRNWVFTFAQLWILSWLTSELLDTVQKQRVFMWVYAVFAILSAFVAIQQGTWGRDSELEVQAFGLAEGANSAARYFIIALIFLNYLRGEASNPLTKSLATVGIVASVLGVFFSGSRTGVLLLFIAFALDILLQSNSKYKFQSIFILSISLFFLGTISDSIISYLRPIIPMIIEGTDTMEVRYALWQAGWKMWLDHIIAGVGIGMYRFELVHYAFGTIPSFYITMVAHNAYIQILAETGIVGFILFISILAMTLKNTWPNNNVQDGNEITLRNMWFIVFVVILVGAFTKTDQADKMLWLVMGMSVYFSRQSVASLPLEMQNRKNIFQGKFRRK
ncbi:MAG: O-antigen ligase family protein [Chloroflexi bacterium]|nr:O-antigen ligase family protein [Chloroflexota bacterium]NOG76242.1 O-antigen ligase family protein [Chloroflexota bacterium]